MDIDWNTLWALRPITWAAAGVVGKTGWDQWMKRRERREERVSQRDEDFRESLRRAYVEFFVAQHHYHDRVTRAAASQTVTASMRGNLELMRATVPAPRTDTYANEVAAMVQVAAEDAKALLTAAALASEKAKTVLLLEDDAAMRKLVTAIDQSETIFYTGEENWPAAEARLKSSIKELASLIEGLGGAFAPRQWYAKGGTPQRYVRTKS